MVHPTFRVMRQSRKTYSLSLKYSSSLKLYALRFMTLILLFIHSTLPVDIWQSYHASIPLLYASIPLLYIQGCKAPMHDIENCCSLLYSCWWLFKYTKCSAVFFRSIQTLSLHFPDEPKKPNVISPNRAVFEKKNVKSATDSCPIYVLFRHNFVYLGPIV